MKQSLMLSVLVGVCSTVRGETWTPLKNAGLPKL